jgi:hypothetical protein
VGHSAPGLRGSAKSALSNFAPRRDERGAARSVISRRAATSALSNFVQRRDERAQ